jgi:hypothetical protein
LLSHAITTIIILSLTIAFLSPNGRVFLPKKTYDYLSGKISECEKEMNHCDQITLINQTIPPGSRLFTDSYLRYWFRTEIIQCGLTTFEKNAYMNLDTPEQRWSFIYGRGFQFIPLHTLTDPLEILIERDLKETPKWLQFSRYEIGQFILLHLTSTDPSHHPQVTCEEKTNSKWVLINQ